MYQEFNVVNKIANIDCLNLFIILRLYLEYIIYQHSCLKFVCQLILIWYIFPAQFDSIGI